MSGGATRFRGWWIVLWCTIAYGMTAPGQTIGVSAFIDSIIDDLGISRSAISTAYLIGTLTGAAALPAIGRWVDRCGVRHAMTVVGVAFATVIAFTATVQHIVMLTVAFVGLRMLGQGSLSLIAQTGVAIWFERRRGLAFAITNTGAIALLSLAPLTFGAIIDAVGWRWAWVTLAVIVLAVVVPIARFGLVDRPADIGQLPDGAADDEEHVASESRSFTVNEAVRTPAFWTLTGGQALTSALITGLTFHNIDLLAERGLSEDQAAAIFIPQMVGSVALGFIVGWLTDRVPARFLLVFAALAMGAGVSTAAVTRPGTGAVAYGLVTGFAAGSMAALSSALYPKWYGIAHVAAIRGVATSAGVAASAVGPLILAVGNDVAGSYRPVLWGCAVVSVGVAACAAVVPTPRH